MNKNLLLSSLVVLAAFMVCNVSYAAPATSAQKEVKVTAEKTAPLQKQVMPPPGAPLEHPDFQHKYQKMMPPPFPSKAEMEAKKAEIDKRLNLTAEQKQKLEKNKEKDRAKIKPIIEKIQKKKTELHEIYKDESLTKEQKDKKIKAVKKDLNKLRTQADNCRKQNMKNFESVLTSEQKTEFEKIKSEQKAEMEKRRIEFEQKRKEFQLQNCKKMPERPLPVPDVKK